MVDNAQITVTYKGRKVKATPITTEQASALSMASTVGDAAKVRIMGAVLGKSLGAVWEDALTDMALGELTQGQLNKLIMDLVKKSATWHAAQNADSADESDEEA